MAIRDEILVTTRDGAIHHLKVERQGGSIEVAYPTKSVPYLVAEVMNKGGESLPFPVVLRVPEEMITAILCRTAPLLRTTPKTKVRRGGIAAVSSET